MLRKYVIPYIYPIYYLEDTNHAQHVKRVLTQRYVKGENASSMCAKWPF